MRIIVGYLLLLIKGGVLVVVLLWNHSQAQTALPTPWRDLIVGELSGRVDPDDLEELIRRNYYPALLDELGIELERAESSNDEIIFSITYPAPVESNRPARLIFRFFESEQRLIAAIITEEVDFAITESDDAAEEVDRSTTSVSVSFRYKPANSVKLLAFNNQHVLLRNASLRKALSYAINRSYMFDRILKGRAFLADSPFSQESPQHLTGLEEYKFNPKKALQLLQNENWRDTNGDGILDKNETPFRVSLIYEKGSLLDEHLVSRIKIDWNKLGIDVVRLPLPKNEIKKRLLARNYDVVLMNYQFEETVESLESFFHSTSKENFVGYRNRTFDRYVALYKAARDPMSRKMLFQALQHEINKDNPVAFLFFLWLERYFVNRNKFSVFQDSAGRLLPFTEWKINRK
ncbi:MAG: ABC transporter substrate-binding protein [candidate division KSB1 bacterium]|nr:ABC transporter substrate-binding protein [candidate division KSB1 bacterium]